MNFSAGGLLAGLIFGVIGIVGWKHGRNIGSLRKLVISTALCLYPYFVANSYLLWGIGGALTAALVFWTEE